MSDITQLLYERAEVIETCGCGGEHLESEHDWDAEREFIAQQVEDSAR